MVIQHNLLAHNANRQYGIMYIDRNKHAEKLSSGYRINRAADDAAGLSISEKMRREIRGLTQGSKNIQEGISLVQVADGYLNEVQEMIHRINELAVKGANDTLTSTDRSYINEEVQAIKTEMSRIFDTATYNEIPIFHVPYMPEIEPDPEPYDIQLFYSGSRTIGGLEFNNIRYSIEELRNIPSSQGQSMKLDANGFATEDQTVKFKLNYPAGEEVTLKLSQGQSLAEVKREYNWTADDTGIYVNNVLAKTWTDFGISSADNAGKNVSFTHRGMKISFDVVEGDGINDIKNGINGDSFTTPATWDISVSGATGRSIAPIIGNSTTRVAVTNANKDDINDKYYISATVDGLAITKTEADGSNPVTTSRTAWNNISYTGNPIADWGEDVDNNDASQISFDNDSTYHYTSPDSNMPIQYYFQLADAASKAEAVNNLDGTEITGNIVCPTETKASNATNGSSVTLTDIRIDGNNDQAFALQNEYGRTYSSSNETLSGNITWEVANREVYIAHMDSSAVTSTTNDDKTVQSPTYFKVLQDDNTYKYYEVTQTDHDEDRNYSYNKTYTWGEKYKLDYTGQLGNVEMKEKSGDEIVVQLTRTDRITYTDNYKYTTFAVKEVAADDSFTEITATDFASDYNTSTRYNQTSTIHTRENQTEGTTEAVNKNAVYSNSASFVNKNDADGGYAFKYTHRITYQNLYELAKNGVGTTGSAQISTTAKGNAYRDFTPKQTGGSLAEPDFLSITVNPPKKHCIIQCAPDVEDQHEIDMEWNPLNLSIAGISGADCTTSARCLSTISLAKESLNIISEERNTFGSYQNRLEHAMRYTDNTVENTQASESRIRDTEMAHEMSDYSNAQILAQAGQMMMAQANQTKQGVLSLLQ